MMNFQPSRRLRALAVVAACFEVLASLPAQTVSTVQAAPATSKKLGLPIVDAVNIAASDEASAIFQKEVLPDISALLRTSLGERAMLADQAAYALDPSKLRLATDSTARVYFVGEGAGYNNTLGFNTLATKETMLDQVVGESAQLIFPNASSSVSTYDPASKIVRTSAAPLLPGDFTDLGKFGAGTTLDFFLIANGASGGTTAFSAEAGRNPDKLNHVIAFALPDSPYLILAFEDMFGGGDRDYNDVIFAVDIGRANIAELVAAPEPGTWAIIIGFLGILLFVDRRARRERALAGTAG